MGRRHREIYVYLRDEYAACRRSLPARDRRAGARSAVPVAAHPSAPRRRRLHLRRGVGDDRDRSRASAACRGCARRMSRGRLVRAAHARAQHGNAVLGARGSGEGRAVVFRAAAAMAARACARSRCRGGWRSLACISRRRASTVRERDRRGCGGHAGRPRVLGVPARRARPAGLLPASLGDVPLDFDTLQPHGAFIGSAAVIVLSQHDRARDAALNLLRFFADESCGQCTPCRVGTREGGQLMGEPSAGTRAPRGAGAGDGRRVDLRVGAGGAESDRVRGQVLPGELT